MADGRVSDALEILRDETPFPGICGRACHRYCQAPCSRKHLDRSISIAALERAAADFGSPQNPRKEESEKTGKRVGVIGAGPAGLSCAYFLARLGHQATLYDAAGEPGGQMRTGRKPYDRLPQQVLDTEISLIVQLGVEFRGGQALGSGLSLQDLADYDAAYLAIPEADARQFTKAPTPLEGLDISVDREVIEGTSVFLGTDTDVKRYIVTHAAAAGKCAALAIDRVMMDREKNPADCRLGPRGGVSFRRYVDEGKENDEVVEYTQLNPENLNWIPKRYTAFNQEDKQATRYQGDKEGYSLGKAVQEARRCLSCGNCNLCELCVMLCPELAITIEKDHVQFDYDYCKGCGICIQECPHAALEKTTAR
jgi:Pyruvate/2-oxoacid:ferredoxin oxidoreductase delta subunit